MTLRKEISPYPPEYVQTLLRQIMQATLFEDEIDVGEIGNRLQETEPSSGQIEVVYSIDDYFVAHEALTGEKLSLIEQYGFRVRRLFDLGYHLQVDDIQMILLLPMPFTSNSRLHQALAHELKHAADDLLGLKSEYRQLTLLVFEVMYASLVLALGNVFITSVLLLLERYGVASKSDLAQEISRLTLTMTELSFGVLVVAIFLSYFMYKSEPAEVRAREYEDFERVEIDRD